MKRHVIIGRFGARDRNAGQAGSDEVGTTLNLLASTDALGHGIGRAVGELAQLGVYPTEIGIDALVLAAHVHLADTRISRSSESQDGWTREIRLAVPVSDPARWNSASLTIVRMLNFLTGDRWTLNFRARPRAFQVLASEPDLGDNGHPFDDVSLFSGGLDSLIGAIDTLRAGRTPLLVSHAGEPSTSDAQAKIFDALKAKFPKSEFERLRLWMAFPNGAVKGSASEDTTRGRSFLFFALGVFAGTGLGHQFILNVPENGLIAVNVPLDPLRLGALSTRTTHPFYIARWNEVLGILGIDGKIKNPYWDKTKGEMVAACSDKKLLRKLITSSLSCASPAKGRWQGHGTQHCGYCLPCLIRRAALLKGLGAGQDETTYTLDDLTDHALDTCQAEGVQIRSFQFAIDRLRARPNLASLLIHKPGPLFDETSDDQQALAGVYRRGLEEVAELLKGVSTEPA